MIELRAGFERSQFNVRAAVPLDATLGVLSIVSQTERNAHLESWVTRYTYTLQTIFINAKDAEAQITYPFRD